MRFFLVISLLFSLVAADFDGGLFEQEEENDNNNRAACSSPPSPPADVKENKPSFTRVAGSTGFSFNKKPIAKPKEPEGKNDKNNIEVFDLLSVFRIT